MQIGDSVEFYVDLDYHIGVIVRIDDKTADVSTLFAMFTNIPIDEINLKQ